MKRNVNVCIVAVKIKCRMEMEGLQEKDKQMGNYTMWQPLVMSPLW